MLKRYYLDVNALNNSHVFNSDLELYFSAWGIFELIAGIKDDKEFQIRKGILKKLKDSNIKIIPHFQSSLCAEIFAFEDWNNNDDVKATLEMYNRILDCISFEEYKKISFSISDKTKIYDYELFQKFDNTHTNDHRILLTDLIKESNIRKKEVSQTLYKYISIPHLCSCTGFKAQNRIYAYNFASHYLKEAIKEGNYYKELLKKINENKFFKNMSKIEKDDLNNQIAEYKYLSDRVKFLQKYEVVQTIIESMHIEKLKKSMKAFDNYITHKRNFTYPIICQDIGANAVLNSQHPARNDSQDLGHLYFIDHVDFFVSNDKFFGRIECLKGKVINLDEFSKNHLNKYVVLEN